MADQILYLSPEESLPARLLNMRQDFVAQSASCGTSSRSIKVTSIELPHSHQPQLEIEKLYHEAYLMPPHGLGFEVQIHTSILRERSIRSTRYDEQP